MTYNYRLSEEAESDIYDSYLWYEKQQSGLGEKFLKVLDEAEQAIITNPNAYQILYKKKIRAFVVNRFPYLILYIVNGKNIDVISVFNTNQHDEKWKKRVE
ncbi:type II toxin-antitoxin system RelE/ParE family toxin [Marinigracilibium pacificum]|uniref:Type II toxin-antitoxin system RelE/ParE family toxin n=1 Tax=Marinigracilibium pacificum TaxID=2729599 RepID=A0A848J0G8_9BACT|nr:type II toxin-antitoxin system RelE/ParE family toxin [Marinigracilibium pacificum]NMM49015.1 type II toxin-antitoxin system RelE/ParE family toxin [Marinigracilibium pacificum]